jgi:large subunit ribosomal protein L30
VARIAITWTRSGIGHKADQKITLESLGLRRLNQTVTHEDNQAIRGMIQKVRHLVKVAEAQ